MGALPDRNRLDQVRGQKYAGQAGVFSLPDLRLTEGSLPKRVISLVLERAFDHRDELTQDWELARAKKPLMPISPLV